MRQFSQKLDNALAQRNRRVIPVVEFYQRKADSIVALESPANAFGRFSNICFDWVNDTGTYHYDAKVLSFPSIESYLGENVNEAEVTFSNVKRGEGSMSRFVLDNQVKGAWMVIRLIFPEATDDSIIVWWGKCQRPGGIDNKEISITATQDLGNYAQEVPFREWQVSCPLDFARPLGGCLGNETLEEKSLAYRQQVALYGTGGCNKLFSTCSLLENTEYFQGQRTVAVSGQFSYITVEEVVKRVLWWTKKKKQNVVHNETWSSVNQSEGGEVIPLAFGRCQIQGHPFSWADVGQQVRALQGFCEGRISAFNFVRSRTEGINIVQVIEHLGDWGGVGTQQLDLLFSGVSGYNSRLAYLEVLTDGSSPTQVDDAPIITAVIRGLEVPVPNVDGIYDVEQWTNNPAHIVRFLLTDTRFGRIPFNRIDDQSFIDTAYDCDEIVEDRSNDESIVLPSNAFVGYGTGYRRYRSASRYSAYKDMYDRGEMPGLELAPVEPPELEEPEIRWFDPFQPYVIPPQQTVLRQKYALNGSLQEKTNLLDFLNKRVLPVCKGWINYGYNGLIQLKNRRKADNGYLRMNTKYQAIKVPVSNIKPWRVTLGGYLVIGVSLEHAELRTVTGFEYSTACNDMPITATNEGGVTATTSTIFSGGNAVKPATAYIDLAGTPVAGDKVEITFNSGDDAYTIGYIADGVEDLNGYTRMLTAFLNASVQFQNYLTAYILDTQPTRINIICESGYLNLDKYLEYEHSQGEEILRVQAVFENCGELTANMSAQFDNIIADSFKWNEDEEDDINAVEAKYISAIDDFHLQKLQPRAAWDTIDLEGELKKEELDLTFVDNYWQAAYLTKGYAIDRIDGNLHFSFSTNLQALRLELGDVVAVRHDSGDGVLNYTPVWITSVVPDLDQFVVGLGAKLYLSAAFDYHVQPIDVLLTTTLNAEETPQVPPPTIGTNGGAGTTPNPTLPTPAPHPFYRRVGSVYSPDGYDKV